VGVAGNSEQTQLPWNRHVAHAFCRVLNYRKLQILQQLAWNSSKALYLHQLSCHVKPRFAFNALIWRSANTLTAEKVRWLCLRTSPYFVWVFGLSLDCDATTSRYCLFCDATAVVRRWTTMNNRAGDIPWQNNSNQLDVKSLHTSPKIFCVPDRVTTTTSQLGWPKINWNAYFNIILRRWSRDRLLWCLLSSPRGCSAGCRLVLRLLLLLCLRLGPRRRLLRWPKVGRRHDWLRRCGRWHSSNCCYGRCHPHAVQSKQCHDSNKAR